MPASRPLMTYDAILRKGRKINIEGKPAIAFAERDLRQIISTFLGCAPFDEALYLARQPGFARLLASGAVQSLRAHWLAAGYFEGRAVFGWESLPFAIDQELFRAPDEYFDCLREGFAAEFDRAYESAEDQFRLAVTKHNFPLAARLALASLLLRTKRPQDSAKELRAALALDRECAQANNLLIEVLVQLKQPDQALRITAQTGIGRRTVPHVARLLRRGEAASARAALRTAAGDWIAKEQLSRAVARTWRDLGNVLRGHAAKPKPRQFSFDDRAQLADCFAKLGRYKAALRIAEELFQEIEKAPAAAGLSSTSYIKLINTVRIARGARGALSEMRRTARHFEDTAGSLATLQMELAYALDEFATVVFLAKKHDAIDGSPAAQQILALALVRLGRIDEALALCREHFASPAHHSWISATVLMSRRIQGVFAGLSHRRSAAAAAQPGTDCKIPKTIMQFWDKEIPPNDVVGAMHTWIDGNRGFQHIVFSEKSATDFLHRTLGEKYVKAFASCHHPAMKADFFRLAYLSVEGGIYVDADEECLGPLDPLLSEFPEKELLLFIAPDAFFVSNGFILCAPGNRIIRAALERATAAIEAASGRSIRPDIWATTGPAQLSAAVAEAMLADGEELRQFVEQSGFLYWEERRRFASVRDLGYKRTGTGNWRAQNLVNAAPPAPALPAQAAGERNAQMATVPTAAA